jgi:hypothetical protein
MTLNFANHPTGFNHMSVVLVHKVGFFVYTSLHYHFLKSGSTENLGCFLTGLTSKNKPLFLEADIILHITSKNRPFLLEVDRWAQSRQSSPWAELRRLL